MRTAILAILTLLALALEAYCQTPEELIKKLKEPEPGPRAAAARALGRQKVEAAIPALAELLADKNHSVAAAAGSALARIGPKSVPALTAALKEPKSKYAALKALGRLGPAAKDASKSIAALLKDDDIDTRIFAGMALAQIGPAAKDVLPDLFEAAKDSSNLGDGLSFDMANGVCEAAVDAALKIDPGCRDKLAKEALPDLIAALKKPAKPKGSGGEGDLQAAAGAIAILGPSAKGAVPALLEAQKKADERGFGAQLITRALLAIGGDGVRAIGTVIKDQSTPLKKRAALLNDLAWRAKADDALLELIGAALKDPSPQIRAAAVGTAESLGSDGKSLVPALIELLSDDKLEAERSDKRFGPESAVSGALSRMGSDAAAPLAAILADNSKPLQVRYQATLALDHLGRKAKAALPTLETALKGKDQLIAVTSAGAFIAAGGDHDKAVPVLQAALKHDDPDVIRAAASVAEARARAVKILVPDLQALLKHRDRAVRIAAAVAICRMGSDAKPAVSAIAELLKSGNAGEIYRISEALRQLGPDAVDALPTLIGQLNNLEKISPNRVLVAIGNMGGAAKPAVPALAKLLKSEKDDFMAEQIALTLGRIGPEAKDAVPQLIDYLARAKRYSRDKALQALGQIGPDAKDALPSVEKLLQDTDQDTRVWSAFAMARISGEPKRYVEMLMEIWSGDGEDEYPGFATLRVSEAFELLGPDAQPARDLLLDAVLDDKTQPGTRHSAARALGHLAGDADIIVPKLVELIERPAKGYHQAANQEIAATILGMFGPKAKAALPALRKLLDDDENSVVDLARAAIEKIEAK